MVVNLLLYREFLYNDKIVFFLQDINVPKTSSIRKGEGDKSKDFDDPKEYDDPQVFDGSKVFQMEILSLMIKK